MKRVLLVKITSMGDLIQMLPALSDATQAIPGIKFDWLADESFKEIPCLHPSVNQIIPLPYRRWKKNLFHAIKSGEISSFLRQLRRQRYDMVIDAQSNLKSAFISLFAKGTKYGLDRKSVREYGAHFLYHKKIHISRQQNHVERLRQMMATFLGYEQPKIPANYGINQKDLPRLEFSLPKKFIFITPIASCENKLWPEPFWHEVIQDVVRSGYDVVLPWWSKEEKERVLRLQNNNQNIHLLPTLNLAQKASVLSCAVAAISIDTGLAHMAAALNIPNVCLYGPSNPEHCGTIGYKQVHLTSSIPSCAPCLRARCTYQGESQYQPACLAAISPKVVLSTFYELLGTCTK